MTTSQKVFISYSHDDELHKEWVYKLACCLVENGVETVLDQWNLQLGSNLMKFMEAGLTNSDRVLVVCTNKYNEKSNAGIGGVGYEKNILTAELYADQDTTKFIPCIRKVESKIKTPICLGGRNYIDFSKDEEFENSLKTLLHELYGVPQKPKPKLGKNPFLSSEEETLPSLKGESSTVFFSHRFSQAFPGVRGIQWFKQPTEAVDRLKIIFSEPFHFKDSKPIWWWRNGDMHIDNFEVLSPDTVIIDHQEFIIDELCAVNAGSYYQTFIYIKTKPSQLSGIYDYTGNQFQMENWGFLREEFALFHDTPITREEYDDGAAVVNGKVTPLNSEAKLRVRFLSPYNLIIAPNESPINNSRFDQYRDEILNKILNEEMTVEDLTREILKLPKIER